MTDLRQLLVGVVVDNLKQAVVQVAVDLRQEQARLAGIKHIPE